MRLTVKCASSSPQRLDEVRSRISGGQQNFMAAAREFGGDGGGHRRFADAALAHQHDQAVAGPFDFIDQRAERRKAAGCFRRICPAGFGRRALCKTAQGVDADEVFSP